MSVDEIHPGAALDLEDRARSLIPYIRENQMRISAARTVPEDVFTRLKEAGLLGLIRPRRYGGLELGPDTVLRVASVLGQGDGSTAWVYVVLTSHDHLVGLYPQSVHEAVWTSKHPACASSYIPTGTAVRVDGGYQVSGKWSFCSGIDHCDWLIVGAMTSASAASPLSLHILLLPKSDVNVIDDWDVFGLVGTGSKSVQICDKFVPDIRALRNDDVMAGRTPGGALHSSPLYLTSIWPLFGFSILAPATGIVRGAFETLVAEATERLRTGEPAFTAKKVPLQMRLAEVGACLDAAELLFERGAQETCGRIMRQEPLPPELRVRNRRDQAYIGRLCRQAMDMLMGATGGRGIRQENSMQRALRDVYAISAHPASSWDSASTNFGSVITGGPITEPFC
jgi:3-hydroxy-9,10-secoandrosta-1,3,5(10)-triene-9,17-dione monooxygenase